MYSSDEPVYLISVVAKILEIHPQTLRQYEREGLIEPSRTSGKMRLYSQNDIAKIEMVLKLTREFGVNLAGVDLIMKLKSKMDEMSEEIRDLKEENSKLRNQNNSKSTIKEGYSVITTPYHDIFIKKK